MKQSLFSALVILFISVFITAGVLSGCNGNRGTEKPSSKASQTSSDKSDTSASLKSETSSTATLQNAGALFTLINLKPFEDYEDNFKLNVRLEKNLGFIFGQAKCPQFSVGNSNIESVGCEIIAVYNAIKKSGNDISCSAVIRDFEKNGYLMAAGHFGSNPYAIKKYFEEQFKYPVTEYSEYSSLQKAVTDNNCQNNVYIVSFWNSQAIKDGLHTVAFYVDDKGRLNIYNLNADATKIVLKNNLSQFVKKENFIIGYSIPIKED